MSLKLRCKQCDHKTTGTYADKCFKCGAVDWERDQSLPASATSVSTPAGDTSLAGPGNYKPLRIVMGALFGLAMYALVAGKWDTGRMEDSGWGHHDAMKAVFMRDWVNGE